MSRHANKKCWIESPPDGWPDGWSFGPGCPLPPGWGARDCNGTVLAALTEGNSVVLLEIYCLDRWSEDTDALEGQVLLVRCKDEDGRLVRCRVTRERNLPWSEALILKVREYEPGKWGVLENVEIDRLRAHGDQVTVQASVWGSQPVLDVEVKG